MPEYNAQTLAIYRKTHNPQEQHDAAAQLGLTPQDVLRDRHAVAAVNQIERRIVELHKQIAEIKEHNPRPFLNAPATMPAALAPATLAQTGRLSLPNEQKA